MQTSETRRRQVRVLETDAELVEAAAQRFMALSRQAISQRGRFVVALSGGRTPKALYERLTSPALSSQVDWSNSYFFVGDERCVPEDSPENNFRMANDTLLSKVSLPARNKFMTVNQEKDPAQSAMDYDNTIRQFFQLKDGEFPHYDLMLLGMGADGHTASLFPGTEGLKARTRLVVANYVKKLDTRRLTMTLPVINHSREILFLVTGAEKSQVLQEVLEGHELKYPAQMVRPVDGELHWYIDRTAASRLRDVPRP